MSTDHESAGTPQLPTGLTGKYSHRFVHGPLDGEFVADYADPEAAGFLWVPIGENGRHAVSGNRIVDTACYEHQGLRWVYRPFGSTPPG